MAHAVHHIVKNISSTIDIVATPEIIWDNITNVKIEQFSNHRIFRLLGIPRPIKAELLVEGVDDGSHISTAVKNLSRKLLNGNR
jgi:hypothetical protein